MRIPGRMPGPLHRSSPPSYLPIATSNQKGTIYAFQPAMYTLSVYIAGEVDLLEKLDMVHSTVLVEGSDLVEVRAVQPVCELEEPEHRQEPPL